MRAELLHPGGWTFVLLAADTQRHAHGVCNTVRVSESERDSLYKVCALSRNEIERSCALCLRPCPPSLCRTRDSAGLRVAGERGAGTGERKHERKSQFFIDRRGNLIKRHTDTPDTRTHTHAHAHAHTHTHTYTPDTHPDTDTHYNRYKIERSNSACDCAYVL